MADETIVDKSDRGSPQYVAWLLLLGIARQENKTFSGELKADKEWVLKTYDQCLSVTFGGDAEDVLKK